MTDTLITLAPFAAYALVVTICGALCYRSQTARRVSDAYDRWDWR